MNLLLSHWHNICLLGGYVHTHLSQTYARRKNWLTIANIIATILVLFMSLSEDAKTVINVYIGFFNVSLGNKEASSAAILINLSAAMVVILTMAQFYFRYEERHLEHRASALEFFNLANKINRFFGIDISPDDIHMLNKQLNWITKGSSGLSRLRQYQNGYSSRIGNFIRNILYDENKKEKILSIEESIDRLQSLVDKYDFRFEGMHEVEAG
ncbi:hypothetical protein [Phreatobacter cathodiphilus]|uniref:hypothetical protein n=1 Tax=Phreatobacter cathodiphilus TaxID=1868589 RepID=UPI0011B29127|nr:hypothetical protein [Phreatobacter cathodiphilus]